MILGKVTGIVAPGDRHPALGEAAFVVVQPEQGGELVAADALGARVGSRVMICQGEAAQSALGGRCPVDAAVAGILDP